VTLPAPAPGTSPLFLRPSFQHRPWGGERLAAWSPEDVPPGPVGECWGVSAHPHGPSTVVGGPHDGRTLAEVWEVDRAFFGGGPVGEGFPLLVKLLDAADWLSVQVHPDDGAAAELEGAPRGKTECWYVVAAEPGAQIVLGHRAATTDELGEHVDAGRWDEVLLRRPVVAGDFVYVPSGTVHALGPGLLVCEVQQSCDTTYRVWDWDRTDADGVARELHLDKAKRVMTAPHDPDLTSTAGPVQDVTGGRRRTLVDGPLFRVVLHEVDADGYRVAFPSYEACTVLAGSGTLSVGGVAHALRAGQSLVLPAQAGEVELAGTLTLLSCGPAVAPR
jgi:mannose-6-phosphate isomerase